MMPEIKEPDLALAGLALLVIFGLLTWYDRPIESARFFDPNAQLQAPHPIKDAYESWLWQDPFGDIDQKKEPEGKKEPEIKKEEGERPHCESRLNEKINEIKDKKAIILAPLLQVQPNTLENKERRTRQRYAVIAGLIESGYRPSESNRLHFCSIRKNSSSDEEYEVRWEHYYYESKSEKEITDKSDIIVVWTNSKIFETDNNELTLDKFALGFENLLSNQTYVYDLDNIRSVKYGSEKTAKIKEKICKNILFINPAGHYEKPCAENEKAPEKFTGELAEKFARELAKKLASELVKRRNIKELSEVIIITEQDSGNARALLRNFRESLRNSLLEDKPLIQDKPVMNAQPIVADAWEIKNVFYLKGLDAYQQILHEQDKNKDQAKRGNHLSALDLRTPPPLPFGPSQADYVHRLAKQIESTHDDIDLKKRDSGIKAVGIFGSDFNDKLLILEALRAEMPNILVFTTGLDSQMLQPQHWRSTRNLVAVSNFNLLLNDKYQTQFPAFRDSQQTNIFYHTVSTVTGHNEKPENLSPQIFEVGRKGFVRLPQEINEDFKYHPTYHPMEDTVEQVKLGLTLLAAIIFSFIAFHWLILPNSGARSIYLSFSTLAILMIALFVATDELGEPLSFTDGVSLWPTMFIQIIAILLAFAFYVARKNLDKNFKDLNSDKYRPYFKIDLKGEKGEKSEPPPIFKLTEEPWLSREWLFYWPRKLFLAGIILIFTIAAYAINDAYPSSFQFWQCLSVLVFFAIIFLLEIGTENGRDYFNFDFIKDWEEKDNPEVPAQNKDSVGIPRVLRRLCISLWPNKVSGSSSKDPSSTWREYYEYSRAHHCVNRVVMIWLFFAIIETILIYLLPPWPWPCRGPTCNWVYWVGVISFIVIMVLLFFILDAVMLSFYWIKKLRRTVLPLLGKENGEKNTKNTLESFENIVTVVAKRTEVVDKLIYFPMLCIMLMLFAKITYFDNQDFPLSKALTFAVSISLLFFSGFMLRYEAEKLKRSVIECAEGIGKNNRRIRPEVEAVTKRIKGICDGAFQPMFEQPVMRALLIILASISLFASKYLEFFG
jgi:hypothetical protein